MQHIDEFRTKDHRVFFASPYFNVDLWHEIEWHKRHIKELQKHKEKPHLFHAQFVDQVTDERHGHFKEHVIDSIPFHKKILEDHETKLKTILSIVPKRTYKKIVNISRKHKGTPEYFGYNKKTKEYFFVAEHMTPERKEWIRLVRDYHKYCDVIVLN